MNFRVVSFGGGVNSAALVIGLMEKQTPPDLAMFADTGAEKPDTYKFVDTFRDWMAKELPSCEFKVVTYADTSQYSSLEDMSLKRKELPSLAYGFKGCSQKWKRYPMDKFCAAHEKSKAVWAEGGKVERCIGIDAGERHRAVLTEDKRYRYRYPLVEWNWDREDCVAAIKRAGLPQPGKSSCFFCPAMRKSEIFALEREHPDLFARAIALERNAVAHTVVGLGRNYKWENLVKADKAQGKLFPESTQIPCDCMDGETEDA